MSFGFYFVILVGLRPFRVFPRKLYLSICRNDVYYVVCGVHWTRCSEINPDVRFHVWNKLVQNVPLTRLRLSKPFCRTWVCTLIIWWQINAYLSFAKVRTLLVRPIHIGLPVIVSSATAHSSSKCLLISDQMLLVQLRLVYWSLMFIVSRSLLKHFNTTRKLWSVFRLAHPGLWIRSLWQTCSLVLMLMYKLEIVCNRVLYLLG